MAARGPTGAARNECGVIAAADQQLTTDGLLLKVALETKGLITSPEHLVVHRAVWIVAGDTAFTGGFVFEDERTALGGVTLEAGLVHARELGATADDCVAMVRLVAIIAGHFAGRHRVRVGKVKLAPLVDVALETGFG